MSDKEDNSFFGTIENRKVYPEVKTIKITKVPIIKKKISLIEIMDENFSFNIFQFLESFLYHFLYFFVCGPFIFIFGIIFNRTILLHNFIFFGTCNGTIVIQFVQFFFIFSSLSLYYFTNSSKVSPSEIFVNVITICIRIFLVCIKYGTFSAEKYQVNTIYIFFFFNNQKLFYFINIYLIN